MESGMITVKPVSYQTVDDFLAETRIPGTIVGLTGLVRDRVRGDPQPNGAMYLVSPGNFVRLFYNDPTIQQALEVAAKSYNPTYLKGMARLSQDGFYDIDVTEVLTEGLFYDTFFLIEAIVYGRVPIGIKSYTNKEALKHLLKLDNLEKLAIVAALKATNQVQQDAAELLAVSARVLNYKMRHVYPEIGAEYRSKMPWGRKSRAQS